MKVAIVVGQDPLLYLLGASPIPRVSPNLNLPERSRASPQGGKGVYTGFPIPADAEIVIEGETAKNDILEEGPFGEWTGYYCSKPVNRPAVRVKQSCTGTTRSSAMLPASSRGRDGDAQGRHRQCRDLGVAATLGHPRNPRGLAARRGAGVRFTVIRSNSGIRAMRARCFTLPRRAKRALTTASGPSWWTTISILRTSPGPVGDDDTLRPGGRY